MRRVYEGDITGVGPNQIIVAGVNTQGRHGLGMALWCKNNAGLKYGHTAGLCGQTWGLITKDLTKNKHPSVRPLYIVDQIKELYQFALTVPNKEILIPYSGKPKTKNLNFYTPIEMASFFGAAAGSTTESIPENIVFEKYFHNLLFNGNWIKF